MVSASAEAAAAEAAAAQTVGAVVAAASAAAAAAVAAWLTAARYAVVVAAATAAAALAAAVQRACAPTEMWAVAALPPQEHHCTVRDVAVTSAARQVARAFRVGKTAAAAAAGPQLSVNARSIHYVVAPRASILASSTVAAVAAAFAGLP